MVSYAAIGSSLLSKYNYVFSAHIRQEVLTGVRPTFVMITQLLLAALEIASSITVAHWRNTCFDKYPNGRETSLHDASDRYLTGEG